jgi:hypothetical protein
MRKKTNKSPKLRDLMCVICNEPFQNHISPSEIKEGKGKVCSKECKNKYQRILNRRGFNKNCIICGKEFYCRPSENIKKGYEKKFCSKECFNKNPKSEYTRLKMSNSLKKVKHTKEWNNKVRLTKIGDKNPMWNNGSSFFPYPQDWKHHLRESIRIRDNHTCQICNKKQENKLFAVHHIDYNKNNCCPENLITLCNSCHSGTNSNRKYWEEKLKNLPTY